MIRVTAGIIERGGKYLIARRAPGKHMAGRWEFPGGKIEPGESPEECLERELMEEFRIRVEVGAHLVDSTHDYGSKIICLMGYFTRYIDGSFHLVDHDRIHWVSVSEMDDYDFAPADLPLIAALKSC
jgi:8-oxo-dGTP diphosphatase